MVRQNQNRDYLLSHQNDQAMQCPLTILTNPLNLQKPNQSQFWRCWQISILLHRNKACDNKLIEVIHLLLSEPYRRKWDLSQKIKSARGTISHFACVHGYVSVVAKLIENDDFQFFEKDVRGFTPLHGACHTGQYNLVKYILLPVRPPITLYMENNIEELREIFVACLKKCSEKGWLGIAKLLLQKINFHQGILLKIIVSNLKHNCSVAVACALLDAIPRCFDSESARTLNSCTCLLISNLWNPHKELTRKLVQVWILVSVEANMVLRQDILLERLYAIYHRDPFVMHLKYCRSYRSTISIQDVLYHALEYGLSYVLELILTYTSEISIDWITEEMKHHGISLIQLSTKNSQCLDIILYASGGQIQNTEELALFKKWYEMTRFIDCSIQTDSLSKTDISFYQIEDYITRLCDRNFRKYTAVFSEIKAIFNFKRDSEDQAILYEIHSFMVAVGQEIRQNHPLFYFEPILAGSASEETRPFRPDEFDYLLKCSNTQAFIEMEQSEDCITHVYIKVQENCTFMAEFMTEKRGFAFPEFKKAMDGHFMRAVLKIMGQDMSKNHIYIDPNFFESKIISCLHLKWRGEKYKDMDIKIDLVPCFTATNIKRPNVRGPYDVYVFSKAMDISPQGTVYPIAYSGIESALVRTLPENGRIGFKLAKAMRIAALLPPEIQCLLTEVFSTEECPKTYILKTSAIMCKIANTRLLSVEEWALLIFRHLELRLKIGEMTTLFTDAVNEDNFLFSCKDPIETEINEERACCVNRKNLLIVVTYLRCFLVKILTENNRDSHIGDVYDIAKRAFSLEPYDKASIYDQCFSYRKPPNEKVDIVERFLKQI